MASLFVEPAEAPLTLREVGDRLDQIRSAELLPLHRVEHQLAIGQLPDERRRESGRLAEYHDQVGLTIGRGVQRFGRGCFVDRLTGVQSLHGLRESLPAITA